MVFWISIIEKFYVINEKALHEQGFFVMGPLYAKAEFKQPGVNVAPDFCR